MKNIRKPILWGGTIIMVLVVGALVCHLMLQARVQQQPEIFAAEVTPVAEVSQQEVPAQPEEKEVLVASEDPMLEKRSRMLAKKGFGTIGGYKISVEYQNSRTNAVTVSETN